MGGPKSKTRRAEISALREILTGCGLTEETKWGKPCFSRDGANIAIIQKMNAFVALMFFKGALLKDPAGVLERPGEHSNHARRFEFTSVADIAASKSLVERYVREAVANEAAGRKVTSSPELVLPAELLEKLAAAPAFKAAFEALTPGRQRGYCLYFSGAKGAEARRRRIDKYTPRILEGRGLHDR